MNKNENKRVNEFELGDRIGKSGMHFVKRNVEYPEKIGSKETYVDAACPFCGRVKAYPLGSLKRGGTTSCSCNTGGSRKFVPQRREDSFGNAQYDQGYEMNFGWIYDSEAGLDTYGNRMVNVHSKWVEADKAVMPLKELDPVENASMLMLYSRWAQSYIDANSVDLSKLVTKEEKEVDDVNSFFAKNPHGRYPIFLDNGQISYAHGIDEYWMKSIIKESKDTTANLGYTAYVLGNCTIRKNDNVIMDCDSLYSDNGFVYEIDEKSFTIYEEYDGTNHSMKNPSERDKKVMFECAKNNQGLFRLSTLLNVFKERNEDAVLAIRKFAIERIQHNILHNYNVGYNEKPTILRASQQRGIEEAILKDGQLVWCQIAKISDFLRIHC